MTATTDERTCTCTLPPIFGDPRMSWKEKGLYDYLASRQGEAITLAEIVAASRDGTSSVEAALKRLGEAGYLREKREARRKGRRSGHIYLLADNPPENQCHPAA